MIQGSYSLRESPGNRLQRASRGIAPLHDTSIIQARIEATVASSFLQKGIKISMKSFKIIRFSSIEIEAINAQIAELRKWGADDQLIELLERSKRKTIREHNGRAKELKEIKKDNEEVYSLIYWHDLQGKSWRECFDKVFPDLWSEDPASFTNHIVSRYLNNREKSICSSH